MDELTFLETFRRADWAQAFHPFSAPHAGFLGVGILALGLLGLFLGIRRLARQEEPFWVLHVGIALLSVIMGLFGTHLALRGEMAIWSGGLPGPEQLARIATRTVVSFVLGFEMFVAQGLVVGLALLRPPSPPEAEAEEKVQVSTRTLER